MHKRLRLGFSSLVLALLAGAVHASAGFHPLARYFPLTVSLLGTLLCALYIIKTAFFTRDGESREQEDAVAYHRVLIYLAWMAGYVFLIGMVGMRAATTLFLGGFLWFEARMRWWAVLISIGATLIILTAMSRLLGLEWPDNLLGW